MINNYTMHRMGNLSKHQLLLFSFITFSTLCLYAQEPTKEQIRKFGITSITTIDGDDRVKSIEVFNKEGELVKILDLNKSGDTLLRMHFIFHDGLLKEEVSYTTMGQVHRITRHQHDGSRRLIRSEYYNGEKRDGTTAYEYDPEGNKVKETKTSDTSGGSVTVFKYSDSRLSEERLRIARSEKTNVRVTNTMRKVALQKDEHATSFRTPR
jgi:YD repeat-containing protein